MRIPVKIESTMRTLCVVLLVFVSCQWSLFAAIQAGVAKVDITPPVGTPLAGFGARKGQPSTGVHDPLEARALVLTIGDEKLALVAVDHLGYDHAMVERVRNLAAGPAVLPPDRILVMATHTHSGGGAYRDGLAILSGQYDPKVRALYEERAAEAVKLAASSMRPARIGFGSGALPGMSRFRSRWPPESMPDLRPVDPELGILLVEDAATSKPMAVLMNFAAHATVLGADNMNFSSDWPGYARATLERLVGGGVMAIYANGAQGTISPRPPKGKTAFERAENLGAIVGIEAYKVLHTITASDETILRFTRTPLTLKPQLPTGFPALRAFGESYSSEVACISFDGKVAMVTVPGELSSILNRDVKNRARALGFQQTFLLGLTNDSVGYIISEDEYRHKTYEGGVSFFGPHFGSLIANEAFQLLEQLNPPVVKK